MRKNVEKKNKDMWDLFSCAVNLAHSRGHFNIHCYYTTVNKP